MTETKVIYNGACPICSREVAVYKKRAQGADAPLQFVDLNATDLEQYGLSADQAAQQLHVVENGTLLAGTDAFLVMWRRTPGFAWLARLVGLPGIRWVVDLVYRRVLAPRLYARHVKRVQSGG